MSIERIQDIINRYSSLKSKSSMLSPEINAYIENRYIQLTTVTSLDYLFSALDTLPKDKNSKYIIKGLIDQIPRSVPSRPSTANIAVTHNFSKKFLDLALINLKSSPILQESHNQILSCMDKIENNCFYSEKNQEDNLRPIFVGIQSIFEETIVNMLKNKEIERVVGIIHTNLPATPVCTNPNDPEPAIHESNRDNPVIVHTVSSRANVIRRYLDSQGVLKIVYNNNVKNERSEEQLLIFEELKQKYSNLEDRPVNASIPEELSGATYFINYKENETYVFAINARQAKIKTEIKEWVLYFGPASSRVISNRVEKVLNFLEEQDIKLD